LSAADPDVPACLHDRAADNWRSLLAIAEAAGGEWHARARRAAVALTQASTEEMETAGIILLADLRELFDAEASGVLFTQPEILPALWRRDDRPWSEYRRGKPLTAPQLAALLKPYGIVTNKTVRRGKSTAKGFGAAEFTDAWARYLPPVETVTRSQASDSAAFDDPGPVTPATS
jgi:hypothetical protein